MPDTNKPVEPPASWVALEATRRPRLVIFDDHPNELVGFVEEYKKRGYDAIGIPLLERLDLKYLNEDGTLNQELLAADQDASTVGVIKEFLGYLKQFEYGIGAPAQLTMLMEKLKPDAILSDRDMRYRAFQSGPDLFAALQPPYNALPKAIHTGGGVDAFAQARARETGYGLFAKSDTDDIDRYLRRKIEKSNPPPL